MELLSQRDDITCRHLLHVDLSLLNITCPVNSPCSASKEAKR